MIGKQPILPIYSRKTKKKTKTIKKGGTDPTGAEEIEFWIHAGNWFQSLEFKCMDEDIGSDDLSGNIP